MASVYNRGSKDRPNWYVRFKDIDGKWKGAPSGQPTKELARQYGSHISARVKRQEIGIPETESTVQHALTVGQLFERFLAEYHGLTVRNLRKYKDHLRASYHGRIQRYPLASLPAAKVRVSDIESHLAALRAAGYRPGTINATKRKLSTVFRWAIRQEIIVCRNPCESVRKLPDEPRDRRYTLDELQALLSLPDCIPSIVVATYTGMRFGELYGLRWQDIDFRTGRITVCRSFSGPTKTGKSRTIPIHRELAPTLQEWQRRCPATSEGMVFPIALGRGWGVTRQIIGWRAATERDNSRMVCELRSLLGRAGCRTDFDRPWHALRHTFASVFSESGGMPTAIERILGHSTSGNQITALYVHVDYGFLARELNKMSLKPKQDAQIIAIRATA